MNTIFRDNFAAFAESINTSQEQYIAPALKCIEITRDAIRDGKKVILCGNGGSSSTASHIANDFVGHMVNWNRRGYPAISLTDNVPVLTALTNDYGYDCVFERQVMAHGEAGDVFWSFSTSGNSENIVRAVAVCKELGIQTVAFTNSEGGKLRDLVDLWIPVNTENAMMAEALHLFYIHSIAEAIEADLDPVTDKG